MSIYPQITAGMAPTSPLLQAMVPPVAYKASDQVLSTGVGTLQDDSALVLPLEATAVYEFELRFFFTGGATGSTDLLAGWAPLSGMTMAYQWLIPNTSNSTQAGAYTSPSTTVFCGTNGATVQAANFAGTLTTSITAGNLQFMWCQQTGGAVATTVKAGSRLKIRRIA